MEVVFDGAAMKRLRKDRHLTQAEVAARSGIAQTTVSRCEKGGVPGVKLLKLMAPVYGMTFDELVNACFVNVPDENDKGA